MNLDQIKTINLGFAYIIGSYIEAQIPFHLVVETRHWDPQLPVDLQDNNAAIFSFTGDTLANCEASDAGVYLFINMWETNHYYDVSDSALVFSMFADSVEEPGKPGKLIFNREECTLAPSYKKELEEIEGKKHSMAMFLSNPDNEKFFNKK